MKTTINNDLRQILRLEVTSKKIRPDRDKKNFIKEVQKNSIFQIFAGKIFLLSRAKKISARPNKILINTEFECVVGASFKKNFNFLSQILPIRLSRFMCDKLFLGVHFLVV
jgi:hypothetical protein